MTARYNQASSTNSLFPTFSPNSLLLYSASTKAFSDIVSTPFENFRSRAQTDPRTYKGMLQTAREFGLKRSFKGVTLNLSLGIIKQCGYRNFLMELATKYNFSPTQAAFLLTLGDSILSQPILRLSTHYVTTKTASLYEVMFKEIKPRNLISFMSRGFSTKFTSDLLGWSIFYSFDPFIKRYARNNSTTDSGYYGIIFGGYGVAGSATEIALAPFKFCLTNVQRSDNPIKPKNPYQLLKEVSAQHGKHIFRGSVPSICSASFKLFTASLIQERISNKYRSQQR